MLFPGVDNRDYRPDRLYSSFMPAPRAEQQSGCRIWGAMHADGRPSLPVDQIVRATADVLNLTN